MKEGPILKQFLVEYSKLGSRLFRNNVGTGYAGHFILRAARPMSVLLQAGDSIIRNARILRAGLCVGSSDLIGWTKITITQDMVGREMAIFTATEIKTKLVKVTKEQQNFISVVNASGGIGVIAHEFSDVSTAVDNFILGDL